MPRRAIGAARSGNIFAGLCGRSASWPRNRIRIGRPVWGAGRAVLLRPCAAPAPRPCGPADPGRGAGSGVWASTDRQANDTAKPHTASHARLTVEFRSLVVIVQEPSGESIDGG